MNRGRSPIESDKYKPKIGVKPIRQFEETTNDRLPNWDTPYSNVTLASSIFNLLIVLLMKKMEENQEELTGYALDQGMKTIYWSKENIEAKKLFKDK